MVKLLENIGEKQGELDDWIFKAQNTTSQEKEKYNEMLVSKMNDQAAEIDKYVEDVNKDELLDEQQPATYALAELEKIKKKFDRTNGTIETYRVYEKTLGNEPMAIDIIKVFEKKFETRFTLWKNREDFGQLKRKWYQEPFKDHDSEYILEQVRKYNV